MMVSLDGFFEGENHDLSWHNVDEEFNVFAAKQMQETSMILFGKKTYILMESFWPSYKPLDKENEIIRERMDSLPKIVFSKTMKTVSETKNWKNITLLHDIQIDKIKKMKRQKGKYISILGSSNLCVSLLEKNLIDELRIMINPVIIGKGTRLFEGIQNKLKLKLLKTKEFSSGNVLLYYQIVK